MKRSNLKLNYIVTAENIFKKDDILYKGISCTKHFRQIISSRNVIQLYDTDKIIPV